MAVNIIEFHGDEKRYVDALLKAQERTRELEQELVRTNKAAADAASQTTNTFKQTEAQQASLLGKLRSQLAAIGPEGAAAAKALSQHMASGGQSTEVAMDSVIEKIRQMNPEAAAAAEAGFRAMKAELADAARFSEGEFQKPLDKLRDMGPEGRKAAEMLKSALVQTGKIGERSMADIIDELRKIDPEAARLAANIEKDLDNAAKGGATAFKQLGRSVTAEIAGMAAGFLSLQGLMGEYFAMLQKTRELGDEITGKKQTFAEIQAEAMNNLQGQDKQTQQYLLNEAPQKIAVDSGFKDVGLITKGLGNAVSAGLDAKQAEELVSAAAQSNALTPSSMIKAISAAADIMATSSLTAKEALSGLASSGDKLKMEEAHFVAESFPKALTSQVNAAPNMTATQRFKEATAIYGEVTQLSRDSTGQTSASFVSKFTSDVSDFLGKMPEERAKAADKVAAIEERIAKGKQTETDKLDLPKLKTFLQQSEGVTLPVGLSDRIRLLQQKPALAEQFEDTRSVEANFVAVRRRLLHDPTVMQEIDKFANEVSASEQGFSELVQSKTSATHQMRRLKAANTAEAERNARQIFEENAAADLADVRKSIITANDDLLLHMGGGRGTLQWFENKAVSKGWLPGTTAPEEAAAQIMRWASNTAFESKDGISPDEQSRISIRRTATKNVLKTLSESNDTEGAKSALDTIENRVAVGFSGAADPQFIEMVSLLREIAGGIRGLNAGSNDQQVPALPALSAQAGS